MESKRIWPRPSLLVAMGLTLALSLGWYLGSLTASAPSASSEKVAENGVAAGAPEAFAVSPFLAWAAGTAGGVALLALVLALALYKGRRALLQQPTYLWPEEQAELMQRLAVATRSVGHLLEQSAAAHASSAAAVRSEIRELHAAFVTMHDALDQRDKELAVLRTGYEAVVLRRILRKFLNVHRVLEATSDRPPDATVRMASQLMQDALEDAGLTLHEPPIGAKYEAAPGVDDSPDEEPTANPDLHRTIAAIVRPGFSVTKPDGSEAVLEKARVRIYRYTETVA